jgi:hypothetical protein
MSFAPIALFVYNRPWHTRQTVNALMANHGASESSLFVFSDGPATGEAEGGVAEVRAYLRTISGFENTTVVERPENLGLANSIIDGVSRICDEFGKVVVVEDDLVTSPFFLQYLNDGLSTYSDEDRVISIHGYLPPIGGRAPENFFLSGADCWGWATWKRGWDLFEPNGVTLLEQLAVHPNRRRFDYIGRYPNTRMLRQFVKGGNNSWAIRWHASAFVLNKLTLHPRRSLVRNIGMDGSGTHCSSHDDLSTPVADSPIAVRAMPAIENRSMWNRFRMFYVILLFRRSVRKLLRINM